MKILKNPQFPEYLIRVLANNGMSENQACVYLACLKLGASSIWDIASSSGVKRTTCYVVMEDLISKGIASVTEDNKKATYSVIGPDELFFNIKTRQNQLAESIGELNALASKMYSKPRIRMFEGIKGIEQVYKLILNLKEGNEILIYGNPDVVVSYTDITESYLKLRTLKRIEVRAILPDTPKAREITLKDTEQLRQTRFFPQNVFNQKTEINILPSAIVYITHSEEKPFATIIENKTLAEEEKGRFEILWNTAKSQE